MVKIVTRCMMIIFSSSLLINIETKAMDWSGILMHALSKQGVTTIASGLLITAGVAKFMLDRAISMSRSRQELAKVQENLDILKESVKSTKKELDTIVEGVASLVGTQALSERNQKDTESIVAQKKQEHIDQLSDTQNQLTIITKDSNKYKKKLKKIEEAITQLNEIVEAFDKKSDEDYENSTGYWSDIDNSVKDLQAEVTKINTEMIVCKKQFCTAQSALQVTSGTIQKTGSRVVSVTDDMNNLQKKIEAQKTQDKHHKKEITENLENRISELNKTLSQCKNSSEQFVVTFSSTLKKNNYDSTTILNTLNKNIAAAVLENQKFAQQMEISANSSLEKQQKLSQEFEVFAQKVTQFNQKLNDTQQEYNDQVKGVFTRLDECDNTIKTFKKDLQSTFNQEQSEFLLSLNNRAGRGATITNALDDNQNNFFVESFNVLKELELLTSKLKEPACRMATDT